MSGKSLRRSYHERRLTSVALELRLLGAASLRAGRAVPRDLGLQPKRLALLCYLAIAHPAGLVRRDALLALLWPELDEARARNALSQALHGLRRALGPSVVLARGHHEVGIALGRLWCDVTAFHDRVQRGELRGAVALYRGELLPAFHVAGAPDFEHWLDAQRAGVRGAAFQAALRLADRADVDGRHGEASQWLAKALEIAPTDEEALRRLMASLDAAANSGAAVLAFETAARRLREEYGLEPSAATLALVGSIRARRVAAARDRPTSPPSLVVLPVQHPGGEASFPGAGLSEALTGELGAAAAGALRVLSHRAAAHRDAQSLVAVRAELGVDCVVACSAWPGETGTRLDARLVRLTPEGETEIWRGARTARAEAMPGVLAAVAREITAALGARPSTTHAPAPPAVDPEAYVDTLRGRHLTAMLPKTTEALASFERAIARAPSYAPAHAGIAVCYASLAVFAHVPPAAATAQLAGAARRAIELDPGLSEAHVALGIGKLVFERDWTGAEQAFRLAVQLNPSSVYAQTYLALYLCTMGWTEEGAAVAAQAAALDPLDPWANFIDGFALYRARRYDASLERLRLLIELYPHHALAHLFVGENELKRGSRERAVQACRAALALLPEDPLLLGVAACVLGLAGRRRQAAALLRALEAQASTRYVNPVFVGSAQIGLGQLDAALASWERMLDEPAPNAFLLKTDPLYDSVRADPRFERVMRQLGLPA